MATPHLGAAAVPLGFIVGLLIGLTGVGGGSLMTPTLVFLGVPPLVAVGSDLLYATITRVLGVAVYGLRGRIRFDIALRLALGSLPAVALGGALLRILPEDALNLALRYALGLVLVVTSLLALSEREVPLPVRPRKSHAILAGFIVGLTVQFTSVGAGVLVGFAMLHIAKLDPREVVGTSLFYGLVLGVLSYANYALLGSVDYGLVSLLAAGTVPGVLLGSWLSSRSDPMVLKRVLNIIILAIGVLLLASPKHI